MKVVHGDKASKTEISAPWGTNYMYYVQPYLNRYGKVFEDGALDDGTTLQFTLQASFPKWKSVVKSGEKSLKLSWSADAGASRYDVLRSTSENYGYKVIASTAAETYTDTKVKKGAVYYYRIRATYPSYGTADSPTIGRMIPPKSKAVKKAVSLGKAVLGYGSYWEMNWSHPDRVFYYSQGSKLYAACYLGKKMKIYGFNSKLKKVSTKIVKLPKHDIWGGMYHGPDGNNYVVLGYANLKESTTKTVVKVIKYSKKWKKGKIASINCATCGKMYVPFEGGTVSFDMKDSLLYMHTCSLGFEGGDGNHHQKNISFCIDTKTMKASNNDIAWASHSFNQRVRFCDDGIYLADHGDGTPRGMGLTFQDNYGVEDAPITELVPFKFQGGWGQNFTGATMGGMEVGSTNVLICGTAQPHDYKIAGVKGFGLYKRNVFLTVTNRTTHESSVKWLTGINPKKGKQTVSETRMVKLGYDRFAVLYSITNDKTGKSTTYCVAVNEAGKKLATKKYAGMAFTGGSQPILSGGCICWADKTAAGKTMLYKVPAP